MKRQANITDENLHSEDLEEIIARPPSSLLKWGISFIMITILMILGMSLFIRYPEIVSVQMKFNTSNSPKALVSRIEGNLAKILVKEGRWIKENTDVAYLDCVADHDQVMMILSQLKNVRTSQTKSFDLANIVSPTELNLGELQSSYQNFYLSYLNFKEVSKEGIFNKRINVAENEVKYINDQNYRIKEIYQLQKRELEMAEREYAKYKLLADKKVISQIELEGKELLLLAKRQAIPQTENMIISNQTNRLLKSSQVIELNNEKLDEEKKFFQALNTFISDAEDWRKQYVITSTIAGYLVYGDFLQNNQLVKAGEKLFFVNSKKDDYYGEVMIPQSHSSKVKPGQQVLIKVKGFPYQEYGYLDGRVVYLSDIPLKDSVFISKVTLKRTTADSVIKLKPGMLADAEIVTEDQSIFKRLWFSLTKNLKF